MKAAHVDRATAPKAATALGIAGLVPFVALAFQVATGWPLGARSTGPALYALQIYGAVILSFLGGVHWGLAASHDGDDVQQDWRRFGAAVTPALVAWAALFLLSPQHSLYALAVTLAMLHLYERTIAHQDLPRWLMRLRFGLTSIAAASLVVAAGLGPF